MRKGAFSLLAACAILMTGCGSSNGSSGGGGGIQPHDITITLSAAGALVLQDGTPAVVTATIGRTAGDTNPVTLSVTGLPNGMQAQFVQPGSGSAGSVSFVATSAAPSGTYNAAVHASEGGAGVSQPVTLTVGIVATVGSAVDTGAGVGGKLQQFLGIVLEPDLWRHWFPPTDWDAVNALAPNRIGVQTIDFIPMKANSGQASDWDFTEIDKTVVPTLEAAGQGAMFRIGNAPLFLDADGPNGPQFVFNDANLEVFATYCTNLVRYYNTGGFDWGGRHFQSASSRRITWWQILNEYNINGLLPSQYIRIYNRVVPAMKALDPSIKFTALELSDGDILISDPRNNVPWFVAPPASGGVNAPVDAATLHVYSAPYQSYSDAQIFASIPGFADDVRYYYQELRSRADLANVPVWITEFGVDSDYQDGAGHSHATGGPFVVDQRGSNAFYAAWLPYVFSQAGKAGSQGMLHWSFSDDQQYGLTDQTGTAKYLSYWAEYWLLRKFARDGTGPDILTVSATETSAVETLATRNSDGSVVVMVANHAVHASADNNGAGDPRTAVVDVSSLGSFASATVLTIDAATSTFTGPAETAIAPAARVQLSLGGYGVTFITLHPAAAAAESYNGFRLGAGARPRLVEAR